MQQTEEKKVTRGTINRLCRLEVVRKNLNQALALIREAPTVLNLGGSIDYSNTQEAITDWIVEIETQQYDLMSAVEEAMVNKFEKRIINAAIKIATPFLGVEIKENKLRGPISWIDVENDDIEKIVELCFAIQETPIDKAWWEWQEETTPDSDVDLGGGGEFSPPQANSK